MTTFHSEWTTLNVVPFQSGAAQYDATLYQSANTQYNSSYYASENAWTSPRSYKLPGGFLVWTIRLPDGESRTCAAKVAKWYSGTIGPEYLSVNLGGVQDDTARGAVVKSPYWGSPHGYMTPLKDPRFISVAGDIAVFAPTVGVVEESRRKLPSQYAIRRAVGASFDRDKCSTAAYLESGNVYYRAGEKEVEVSSSSSESSPLSNESTLSSSSFSSRSTSSGSSESESSSSSQSPKSESSSSTVALPSSSSFSTETLGTIPMAGMIVWLDADDRVTVKTGGGGAVNEWHDKSPIGAIFSPQGSGRPAYIERGDPDGVNGRAVVKFRPDIALDSLLSDSPPGTIGGDFTMLAVMSWKHSYAGSPVYSTILNNPSSYDGVALWIDSMAKTNVHFDGPPNFSVETSRPESDKVIFFRIRLASRNGKVSLNDVHYNFSSGPTGFNWSSLELSENLIGKAFRGRVAEIIVYDRRLSNAEFSQVESYLYSKWGMDYSSSSYSTAEMSTSSRSSKTTALMSTSSGSTTSTSLSSTSISFLSSSSSSQSPSSLSTTSLLNQSDISSTSGDKEYYAYCEWQWIVAGTDPNGCLYYQSVICSPTNLGGIKGSITWHEGEADTGCFRQNPTPDFPYTVTRVRKALPVVMPKTRDWLEVNYPEGSECCSFE